MHTISPEEMKELLAVRDPACASIYLSSEDSVRDTEGVRITLKDLIVDIEEQLECLGFRGPSRRAFTAPARDIMEEPRIWRSLDRGLALFLTPGGLMRRYDLPIGVGNFALVSCRFYAMPLYGLFTGTETFHLLALSLDEVRWYRGDRFHLEELTLEPLAVPAGISQVERSHVSQGNIQFFTGGGGRLGQILDFLHAVEPGITNALVKENTPLIIAGTENITGQYRKINRYPHLVDEAIPLSPLGLTLAELHGKALAILSPRQRGGFADAKERFYNLAGTGRTSSDPGDILPAAAMGRVHSLFVDRSAHRWGTFDPATLEATFHDEREPGDEDLLDAAAAQTFMHDGTVYPVTNDEIPCRNEIAANFRF